MAPERAGERIPSHRRRHRLPSPGVAAASHRISETRLVAAARAARNSAPRLGPGTHSQALRRSGSRSPFAPFVLPKLSRERFDNGLAVLAAARGRLPLFSACLAVPAGSGRDPPGQAGLSDFVVELLRRGTRRLGTDDIDERVEAMGIDLRLETTPDSTFVSATAPSEHLAPVLELVAELVLAPRFSPSEVTLARKRTLGRLETDLDDPSVVAHDALFHAALGDHPYAHPGRGLRAHVARFRPGDCRRFHDDWYRPGGAVLSVVGDLDPREVLARARRLFGPWRPRPKGGAAPTPIPPIGPVPGRTPLLVHRPEATQAQVRLASAGPGRLDAGLIAARLTNQVFGGGFTSRLVEAVRVDRGLSYGVASFLSEAEAGGLFCVSTFTKNETVGELVRVVLDEAARYRRRGPGEEELERARRCTNGLFPLGLETVEQLARALAEQVRWGRPDDWLTRYRERVEQVARRDARAAARLHVLAGPVVLAVVGDARALEGELARFGRPRVVGAEAIL